VDLQGPQKKVGSLMRFHCIDNHIELGANWIGDKYHMGDRATPEGRYFIRKKKSRGQTIYYRALEIDYPNADDQKAFKDAKKKPDPAQIYRNRRAYRNPRQGKMAILI
jgi:murein L,D-transpeptidase YafK